MDFNDKLQKLKEEKKYCLSEVKNIENEKQTELEKINELKKQTLLKYAKLNEVKYQELEKYNSEIDSYCQLIESYSYFDVKIIGKAIASLIRIFEGTNYVYQEAEYYTIGLENQKFIKVVKHPKIVIAEGSRRNGYSDYSGAESKNLHLMLKTGEAIILTNDMSELKIPFYHAKKENHTLELLVKIGKFSYVKDFIDELISYKIEHSLKDISLTEIENLKIDFISSRKEQIEENYRLVTEQQEKQMKKKLENDKENRQLLLKRVLDKKEKSGTTN